MKILPAPKGCEAAWMQICIEVCPNIYYGPPPPPRKNEFKLDHKWFDSDSKIETRIKSGAGYRLW